MPTNNEWRKKLESTSEVISDHLWYVNPVHISNLIDHVQKDTVREILAMETEYQCECGDSIIVIPPTKVEALLSPNKEK